MRNQLIALLVLLCIHIGSYGCTWDYDTLAAEAKGLPEVVDVLTGRFDRNPALYYEMRLDRVTKLLEQNPGDFEAYDGAGVSCDRLGRSDEAMDWMAKKAEQLALLDPETEVWKEHQYRYLANLGTFHAHRWFRSGANRNELKDLERARDLLVEAIELNPDAHFGRERYQLRFIEWCIKGPELIHRNERIYLPDVLGIFQTESERPMFPTDYTVMEEYDDAIEGLTGLMVLGAAWESLDVIYELALVLEGTGFNSIAHLARLRCNELIDAGRGSIVLEAPKGEELKAMLHYYYGSSIVFDQQEKTNTQEFTKLRENANTWHAHRTEYMMERLEQGEHPDTHPDFWSDYKSVKALKIRRVYTQHQRRQMIPLIAGGAFVLALVAAGAAFVIFKCWKSQSV